MALLSYMIIFFKNKCLSWLALETSGLNLPLRRPESDYSFNTVVNVEQYRFCRYQHSLTAVLNSIVSSPEQYMWHTYTQKYVSLFYHPPLALTYAIIIQFFFWGGGELKVQFNLCMCKLASLRTVRKGRLCSLLRYTRRPRKCTQFLCGHECVVSRCTSWLLNVINVTQALQAADMLSFAFKKSF